MRLQFQDVFTRERMRSGEKNRQALVNHLPVGIPESQVSCLTRRKRMAAQRLNHRADAQARNTDDADSAATGRGGNRHNGMVMTGQHDALMEKGR